VFVVDVELWLSVMGPRGNARAADVADGTIGPPHPTLPTATMVSGTVLEPGEDPRSERALAALAPWRVVPWHAAYAVGGAGSVDGMPGGQPWRAALEVLEPEESRHLLAFEGHVTHIAERDRLLFEHLDVKTMVAESDSIGRNVARLAESGFCEVMYTPSGPDVRRELEAWADAVCD